MNLEKCHLVPLTRLVRLGALIDTLAGQVFLSQEMQESIQGFNSSGRKGWFQWHGCPNCWEN